MSEQKKTRKPYKHPNPITDTERKTVVDAYKKLSDNTIQAIADLTGFNYSRVDKIVDDFLKTPKQ